MTEVQSSPSYPDYEQDETNEIPKCCGLTTVLLRQDPEISGSHGGDRPLGIGTPKLSSFIVSSHEIRTIKKTRRLSRWVRRKSLGQPLLGRWYFIPKPVEDLRILFMKSLGCLRILSYSIGRLVYRRHAKYILLFLVSNFIFMLMELLYGWWTNSLGLFSDGLHMLFDSSILVFGLIASEMAKLKADTHYTYGYARVETLTCFISSALLLCTSVSIVNEAFRRLKTPQPINADHLLPITIMGLFFNLLGLLAFNYTGRTHSHHHHLREPSSSDQHNSIHSKDHSLECDMDQSEGCISGQILVDRIPQGEDHSIGLFGTMNRTPLVQTMFLHILADSMSSIGVVVSSVLVRSFGWIYADSLCSILIAILILMSAFPLFVDATGVLMQRVPPSFQSKIHEISRQLMSLEGVITCSDFHIWELCSTRYIGTIKIQMKEGYPEQKLRKQAIYLMSRAGIHEPIVQIECDSTPVF